MNTLILNRETFDVPADGWHQIAPLGEFPHGTSGVVQVVDREACAAMVQRFDAEAAVTNDPNLKGMLPLSNRGQWSEVRGQGSG